MICAATVTGAAQRIVLAAFVLINIKSDLGVSSRLIQGVSHDANEQVNDMRSSMRQLLDNEPDQPVFVSSPRELEGAILQGRQHIVVTAHLDMTALPLRATSICPDGCESPLPEIRETHTIRGECVSPPDDNAVAVFMRTPGAVDLIPFQDKQCLIMTNEDLFPVLTYRFWVDNLYLRAVYHNVDNERQYQYISLMGLAPMKWPLKGEGKRFVTRSTFQGDGLGPTVGVWADENLYIENCTFVNLGGDGFDTDACGDCSSAINVNGAFVTVVNSTFYDPMRLNGTAYIRAWEGGSVSVSGCSFDFPDDVEDSLFYQRDNSTFYSTDPLISVRSDEGQPQPPLPIAQAPAAPPGTNSGFLKRIDPWLISTIDFLNETLTSQPSFPAPAKPVAELEVDAESPSGAELYEATPVDEDDVARSPVDDDDDDGLPTSAIIAIIVPILLLLLICLAAFFALRRHKQRKKEAAEKAAAGAPARGMAHRNDSNLDGVTPGAVSSVPWDKTTPRSDGGLSAVGSQFGQQPSHATSVASTARGSIHGALLPVRSGETSRAGSAVAVPAPPPGAPVSSQLAFVQSQLDSLGPDDPIMSQFRLLGSSDRRQGSHSVVAFAIGTFDRLPYAIKFFVTRQPFIAELAMRDAAAVGTLATHIKAINDPHQTDLNPGPATDRFGRSLPPCIVVSRGESLTEWSHRAKPDVFQAVAVLAHVATRLRDIHAVNYVHRDVKPAHIILLPRENRWTIVDFDRAAACGSAAPPDYTLDYAPPEVLAAAEGHEATIIADPSQDAWALGVVAFELLTGSKAFEAAPEAADAVKAQLRGALPLPWEGDKLCSRTKYQLGIFCDAVLALLRRDPAKRASMQDFCNTCNDVVMSHTTVAGQ